MQQQQQELKILGAAFGVRNVTDNVQAKVKKNYLQMKVDFSVLDSDSTDPMPGVPKMLVIVYQYYNYKPRVKIAREGTELSISPPGIKEQDWVPPPGLKVAGAAYGVEEVTEKVISLTSNGTLGVKADNSLFSDNLPGMLKAFVLVYLNDSGSAVTRTWLEGDYAKIGGPKLTILAAVYGLASVTEKVQNMVVDDTLSFQVETLADKKGKDGKNDILFEDSWPAVIKTLVIAYQYDNNKPQLSITKEHERVEINPSKHLDQVWIAPPSGQMEIVGAAYGPTDVTSIVASKVQSNFLNFMVGNQVLAPAGDPWKDMRKSFVVVYYDTDRICPRIHLKIENQPALLSGIPLKILKATQGKDDITEIISSDAEKSEAVMSLKAPNTAQKDASQNVARSFAVIGQYGNCKPFVRFSPEDLPITIFPSPELQQPWNPPQGQLTILGAVYGLADVTDSIARKVQNNKLDFVCNETTFTKDSWPYRVKTLTLVYRDTQGKTQFMMAEENQRVTING